MIQRKRVTGSLVGALNAGRSRDSAEKWVRLLDSAPGRSDEREVFAAQCFQSSLGPMLAVADDRGVCMLKFLDGQGVEAAVERLRDRGRRIVVLRVHPHLTAVRRQVKEYFAGKRREFDVPLRFDGTPFQNRAWAFLRTIPFGETRTYAEAAGALGNERAVRAAGRANGTNRVVILVPCHRLLGADGALTGYGGGVARKRWLLDHERRS